MKINMLRFVSLVLMIPSAALAGQREVHTDPVVRAVKVGFNHERLSAWYLIIDARSEDERKRNREDGSLPGPVLVFFHGHAQRPDDAFPFTSILARKSRAGIVIIPVCDTPYGRDEDWRGDRGKDVILMEMVRHALLSLEIRVTGFIPLNEEPVMINGSLVNDGQCSISADLVSIGWSHGGILARRSAHAYPGSVISLGQVCPAGYERMSPLGLTGRFAWESLRMSKLTATGHAGDTLKSAWGFIKGMAGDFFRSFPDAVMSVHPAKVFRTCRDVKECSLYCDGLNLRLDRPEYVKVIFGEDDTCMSPQRILGTDKLDELPEETVNRFRATYFSDVLSGGTILDLEVLPGTHLAPLTHNELYATTLLRGLGQLVEP